MKKVKKYLKKIESEIRMGKMGVCLAKCDYDKQSLYLSRLEDEHLRILKKHSLLYS